MDLIEIGCKGVDWSGLANHRDMWWAEHGSEPLGFTKYGGFLDQLRNC